MESLSGAHKIKVLHPKLTNLLGKKNQITKPKITQGVMSRLSP